MDDLSIQGPELERTLYEIEFINRTLGGYGPTFEGVRRLLPAGQKELSILDVGTGSGDIPRRLVDWGRGRGLRVHVTGIDLTETAVDMAQRTSSAYETVDFKVQDLFDLPDVPTFDIVHAAATLHHFVGQEAQRALSKMYRVARLGVVINDFHRHFLAWAGIRTLTALFSQSRLVRYDAPLSVLRSFHRQEIFDMCRSEGLPAPEIAWRPMFRWRIVVQRGKEASSSDL